MLRITTTCMRCQTEHVATYSDTDDLPPFQLPLGWHLIGGPELLCPTCYEKDLAEWLENEGN